MVIIFAGSIIYLVLSNSTPEDQTFPRKVVIIDNLSISDSCEHAHEVFAAEVRDMSVRAQMDSPVKYYNWREVKVDLYQTLPSLGYGIVILRVHSGILINTQQLCFFTSELMNPTAVEKYYHLIEQQLLLNATLPQTGESYVGVSANFFAQKAEGRFKDSIVIAMGCHSYSESIAKIFVDEKDAKVYIGWNKAVTASHTDTETTRLLEELFIEKQTIDEAVKATQPDPYPAENIFGSRLEYYPSSAWNFTIPSADANTHTSLCVLSTIAPTFLLIFVRDTQRNFYNIRLR